MKHRRILTLFLALSLLLTLTACGGASKSTVSMEMAAEKLPT